MSSPPSRAPIDVAALHRGLVGPTAPLRRLDVVTSTGSTNADLLDRHSGGDDIRGTLLVAEHQTAGRGRNGRSWSAPPRSQIAMSMGIDAADVTPQHWGWLPLLTGVALVDAVHATTGIEAGLKWPNDLMVGTGKLGGILAEVAAPDPVIVIGVGLNVSLTGDEATDPRATSLLMLGAAVVDRDTLLKYIVCELVSRIEQWRREGGRATSLMNDYRQRSVTLGAKVRAILPGDQEITGIGCAVDDLGRLNIDTGDETVAVSAGDIVHLRPGTPT